MDLLLEKHVATLNQASIWHSPTDLEVVRQLCSPCIPRIHRNEDSTRGYQLNHPTLKIKLAHVGFQRVLYGEKLLGNHWKHFDINTIELVEAGPRAALGQASKKLAHELVV